MSKKQEIATAQSNALAAQSLDEWGAPPVLSSKDTIISKIHLMQQMSKQVIAKKAEMGDLRDSVTNELFGSLKDAMEFIPFFMQATWLESEWDKATKKYEYKRTFNVTPDNDNLAYEDEEAGLKRVRTLNFYVLLPKEIESGSDVPRIMSFAVTSRRGGQKLTTQMYVTSRMQNKAPAAVVMKLLVETQSNAKGTFAVKDCEPSRPSTQIELDAALKWFKVVRGPNNLKVDESDLVDDSAADVGDTGAF